MVPPLLDLLGQLLDQVHRRHLAVALQQVTSSNVDGSSEILAVCFVDLVGFSGLAQDLHGDDLGNLVSRFEVMTLEICVAAGAHVVKMIGDAVMFVSPHASIGVHTALQIVEAAHRDPLLPDARAGLDYGAAVALGGDYFGQPVNVASRLTSFARPDTVVCSEALLNASEEESPVSPIGRVRLKGVGPVRAFKVKPS